MYSMVGTLRGIVGSASSCVSDSPSDMWSEDAFFAHEKRNCETDDRCIKVVCRTYTYLLMGQGDCSC